MADQPTEDQQQPVEAPPAEQAPATDTAVEQPATQEAQPEAAAEQEATTAPAEGEPAGDQQPHDEQMQQQMDEDMQQQDAYMGQQEQQEQQPNYYDSIETDEFVMPPKFEVEIRLSDNQIKIVTVEVEKQQRAKPYFGGYRNNRTGVTFHHAFSQTDQIANYHPDKNERMVQTYQYKTKSTHMMREQGAQMERPGLFIDRRDDKIIFPGRYYSSDRWMKDREKTTLYIQCMVRGWFARKRAFALRKARFDRDQELLAKQKELQEAEEKRHKEEIERRMHPKTAKDFEILYNELEAWRLNETKKIKNSSELSHDEKALALEELLKKETKILQQIDRLKIQAHSKNKTEKTTNFLRAMSDPKLWKRSDGRFTEVHTPFSTRAKELMDLYNGLRLPMLTTDERLDVLLHTKWTVVEFDCNLTREIVDLIDREADMLNRGRSETSLEGLRLRLSNLFLQFIETPEFNPEAARFQKVPRELLQQTQAVIFE